MTKPLDQVRVDISEILCRFVFSPRYVRSNGTVRHNAFVPKPNQKLKLSVTRSEDPVADGIWNIGRQIEAGRTERLQGRADVIVPVVLAQDLRIEPAPVDGNRMHANIVGWPAEKQEQLMVAKEIANRATYHRVP